MAAKLNLNLDKINGIKPVTIYHSIHYKGNRFRISSGQSIEPNFWDKENQKVKRIRENFTSFNKLLKKQQNDIERVVLDLEIISKPINKENIAVRLTWNNSIEVKDFKPLGLFKQFIEIHRLERAARTVKGYNTTLSYLTKYELTLLQPISFVDFNEDFYKRFRDYLGMYDNAFGFYIKNLKTFLNWANDKGYNDYLFFRKWKILNEDGKDHFFLKHSEIKILANFKFESRLDKVRDLFLIGCYCGLRYSDLSTLKPIHVQDGMIKKVAFKTNEGVKIPVIPELQKILNKYWKHEQPLPQISNQKGNQYLKELAKLAKLKRTFNYIQKKNKTSTENTFEAWQMMSWHVARHSFITNCIQLGIPQDVVMRLVGHKSYNTLKKYIQNDDDFNKKEIMKISRTAKKVTK